MNEELVNHPKHYLGTDNFECLDLLNLIFTNDMPAFYVMNAFKYTWRAGRKANNDKATDYAKARFYMGKYHELCKFGQSESSGNIIASKAPVFGAYADVAKLIDSILDEETGDDNA